MALIERFLRRTNAIMRIPDALARGLSPTAFIKELGVLGLTYRRTTMLADWRSQSGIEAKKDVWKYTRRDRVPTMRAVADVEWEYSKEYIYKVNTWSRTHPDEPLQERMVTVLSDELLTLPQIEAQVEEQWGKWERYEPAKLERERVVGVYHRIPSPLEEE